MRTKTIDNSQRKGLWRLVTASWMFVKESAVDAMAILWLAQGVSMASDGIADPDGNFVLLSGMLFIIAGLALYPLKSIAGKIERRFEAALETKDSIWEANREAVADILGRNKRWIYVIVCVLLCSGSMISAVSVLRQRAQDAASDSSPATQEAINSLAKDVRELEQRIDTVYSGVTLGVEQVSSKQAEFLQAMANADKLLADDVHGTHRQLSESMDRLHDALSALEVAQNSIRARLDELAGASSDKNVPPARK